MRGSVWKKGKVWYCLLYIGRKQRWFRGGPKKEDAQRVLTEKLQELNSGTYSEIRDRKILFREFTEKYLAFKKSLLKISTLETNTRQIKYLNKYFKDYPLIEISPYLVENFIQKRLKEVSPITLNNELTILGDLFRYALKWNYVKQSPMTNISRPRVPKKELKTMSLEEIQKLISLIRKEKYRMVVKVGAFMGLRSGEVWGLQWQDVNFEKGTLSVRRSVFQKTFLTPKTESGVREIHIPEIIRVDLKRWKLQCPIKNTFNLVFPSQNGGIMKHDNFMTQVWTPTLKRAGLPHYNFHSLRHFNISFRIQINQNLKFIQREIGHSSPNLILNNYSHVLRDENFQTQQRQLLDKALLLNFS